MQVTIANGASLSNAAFFTARQPQGIAFPASVEGSVISFQGTHDGETWSNLYGIDPTDLSTVELNFAFTSSTILLFPKGVFDGLLGIKVRTGLAGGASNQTGAAVLTLLGI